MSEAVEVRMPNYPDCWETCGACYSGSVEVAEVLVKPGDRVVMDDPIIVLELDKTTLDITSTAAGRVVDVRVEAGDSIEAGAVIITVQPA